jgi:transcription elongation factor Elf1
MTAEMLREELYGRMQLLGARAHERGHNLHPWAPSAPYSTRTACRACGARLAVTVTVSNTETIETAATQNCK